MIPPKPKQPKSGSQFPADLIDDDWPDAGIVVAPRRRSWRRAALVFILAAIAADFVSKHFAGLGMMTMARSGQAMTDAKQFALLGMDGLAQLAADESARLKQIAMHKPCLSDFWGLYGLGLFLVAAGCWGVSHYRTEGGSPVVLTVLFFLYVMLLMLMV